MKDMAMSYQEKSEGYRFLFDLSCLCLRQLVKENVGWGPEWVEEWTPLQYLAKLQEKVAKTQLQGRYEYSAIDQSEEAIYQATTKPQFGATATLLQLALQQLKMVNPEQDSVTLPPSLTVIGIISNFQRLHDSANIQMKIGSGCQP